MGIPGHLLLHEVTVVHPAAGSVDAAYGTTWDYGASATRTTVPAWLEQTDRSEAITEGRTLLEQRWTLLTNHPQIDAVDRVEWAGHPAGAVLFRVDGTAEPVYTPRGFHHLEATLRIVEG